MKVPAICCSSLLLCAVACLATESAFAGSDGSVEKQNSKLDWLTGRWCMSTGSRLVQETWSEPVGGQLLGMSRTIRDGKVEWFEFMRIESDAESTRFIAQPGGVPPTTFTATEVSENLLVVENPGHDFPQKVVYRRDGDSLLATISGPGDDGQEQSINFSYERCQD